jgi:phospholipase/carboxylesterase
MTATLKDYSFPPASGKAPDSVVIFLHGLGDNGMGGLLELGRRWQRTLPNTEFICPDAPFVLDLSPEDFGAKQWFSLQSYNPTDILKGVKIAAPILNDYIDSVLKSRNLTPDRLALVGFSQGTMMALYTALRRAQPVAAIIGYSGKLIDAASLAHEKRSAPPVLLVHGTADEVVPFASLAEAERELKTVGISVRTLPCARLAHSINESGIAAGAEFLQHYLG